jgi:energy-coupling factor transporter ATP-binding protein EcfA2
VAHAIPTVPVVPWPTFLTQFAADWRQGEHVTAIGPTGCGKTTLVEQILPIRAHVVGIGTKIRDPTLDHLLRVRPPGRRTGRVWTRLGSWPPPGPPRAIDRWILWPKLGRREDLTELGPTIREALDSMLFEGGWCVWVDELWVLCDKLGCAPILEEFWFQGRSNGLSLVGSTQVPAHVPLAAYGQATHLFLWHDPDKRRRIRLSEIGGVDPDALTALLPSLSPHQCVAVNTRARSMVVTQAPRVTGG